MTLRGAPSEALTTPLYCQQRDVVFIYLFFGVLPAHSKSSNDNMNVHRWCAVTSGRALPGQPGSDRPEPELEGISAMDLDIDGIRTHMRQTKAK